MNTTLLKKVKAAILKHPDQFEMNRYFAGFLGGKLTSSPGGCGTAACIGGWAVHLRLGNETLKQSQLTAYDCGCSPVRIQAEDALSLSRETASRLFYASYWPVRFRRRYDMAKRPKTRARAAADRIDHFIKTKGEE